MKKQIIAFFCLAAVCLSLPNTSVAYASNISETGISQPSRWTNTTSIALGINFVSGNAHCTGTIIGKTNVKKIEATFQLLKKNTNGQFISYYSWPKVYN